MVNSYNEVYDTSYFKQDELSIEEFTKRIGIDDSFVMETIEEENNILEEELFFI